MGYSRQREWNTPSLLSYHLVQFVTSCHDFLLNEKSKSLWHFIERVNLHEEFFKISDKIMNNTGFLSMSCFFKEDTISDDHLSEGCLYCRDPQTYPNFGIWTSDLNFHRHRDHTEESHRRMGFIELEVNEILCCLVLNISAGLVCLVPSFYILILSNSLTIISFAFLVLLKTLVKYSLKELKKHQKEVWHFSILVFSYLYFSL